MNRLVSVAPMMDWTDRHDRYFLRLISPHVLLYTEMITTSALMHGDQKKLLQFHEKEHPIALQLGGSDPKELAISAKLGEEYGYDEVNLNVGCPSDRVKQGRFGACLMLEPHVVANGVSSMVDRVKIPVTVKCRIGVDDQDSYESLCHFIECVSKAGCSVFIIHARKAWLKGLSPKQNREIPPLQYDVVKKIKQDFPHLTIILNGGIRSFSEIQDHLKSVDGVMIGREAYSNPYFLAEIEEKLFKAPSVRSRKDVLISLMPYIEEELKNKTKLSSMTRHLLGLCHAQKGARLWRRFLSEEARKEGASSKIVRDSLSLIEEE